MAVTTVKKSNHREQKGEWGRPRGDRTSRGRQRLSKFIGLMGFVKLYITRRKVVALLYTNSSTYTYNIHYN